MIKPIKLKQDFIRAFEILDLGIMDNIISYYEKNKHDTDSGAIGYIDIDNEDCIDTDIKDSLDLSLPPSIIKKEKVFKDYFDCLTSCLELYLNEYQYANGNISMTEHFNIQYYNPGGGFKQFHYETNDESHTPDRRHLVFMTYLNDINSESKFDGGTEFLYQNLKMIPKKGITLIWPSTWQFTHKSIVAPKDKKYIITGWLSKLPRVNSLQTNIKPYFNYD